MDEADPVIRDISDTARWMAVFRARVILPALSRPGALEPDLMFSACLMKKLAGGVLVTKVNDLS